jgi:hypothetical protein
MFSPHLPANFMEIKDADLIKVGSIPDSRNVLSPAHCPVRVIDC